MYTMYIYMYTMYMCIYIYIYIYIHAYINSWSTAERPLLLWNRKVIFGNADLWGCNSNCSASRSKIVLLSMLATAYSNTLSFYGIYIYVAVSHLFSNEQNNKDRQHTNFGKYMHGCRRAKRAERRARLECNSYQTC